MLTSIKERITTSLITHEPILSQDSSGQGEPLWAELDCTHRKEQSAVEGHVTADAANSRVNLTSESSAVCSSPVYYLFFLILAGLGPVACDLCNLCCFSSILSVYETNVKEKLNPYTSSFCPPTLHTMLTSERHETSYYSNQSTYKDPDSIISLKCCGSFKISLS